MRNRQGCEFPRGGDPPHVAGETKSSRDSPEGPIREITAQIKAPFGRPERVFEECRRLRALLPDPPTPNDLDSLRRLSLLLSSHAGPAPRALFDFLENLVQQVPRPWPILLGLFSAVEPALGRRALALARSAAERGGLPAGEEVLEALADAIDASPTLAGDPSVLRDADEIVRLVWTRPPPAHPAGLADLMVDSPRADIRRLAARLLDLRGEPAAPALAARLLGREAGDILGEYLAYTRAGHLDLLALVPVPGSPPPLLPSFRRAEATCGKGLLREAVAALGWPASSLGLEATRWVRVSVGDAFPYVVSSAEASLFRFVPGARRQDERILIVAHGGDRRLETGSEALRDRVARFRALNLAHAEILPEFIDVAPLTGEKIRRLLEGMDRIVAAFTALFTGESEEASILPSVYAALREKIRDGSAREGENPDLSASLARLVQGFEDPATLGSVETLHGLKRYLHQRGLRLGFRLVEGPRGVNRTVSFVTASPERILSFSRPIEYADFEPGAPGQGADGMPRPVTMIASGFGRQLLQGIDRVPSVRVFCYGHEAHYYFAFGAHPAFLRIDFSPPLRGGLIDLEYFGVSKNELGDHPAPSLPALGEAFRALEFDVRVDRTQVLARYDKERAVGLDELEAKAEDIFSLAPYWMDLDWVLGSLDLDSEAKARVAAAWAYYLRLWGIIPLAEILTSDRRGILLRRERTPAGECEVRWPGDAPYRDRFAPAPAASKLGALRSPLERLSPDLLRTWEEGGEVKVGQVRLERLLLRPLREAIVRGEVKETPNGLRPRSPRLFERDHEAKEFARILAEGGERLGGAAAVAGLVAPLEKGVRFRTTGSVNDHEVERAGLRIGGATIALFVLRDPHGVARLAGFARGRSLCRSRSRSTLPWRSNLSLDPVELGVLLREANVLEPEGASEPRGESATALVALFSASNPSPKPPVFPGEISVPGIRVSPGRAIGRARFGAGTTAPEDLDGGILVAPALRPADLPSLDRALGVLSTGGGALSHLGLAAQTLGKPGLIVSGRWGDETNGERSLALRAPEYREEVERVEGFRVAIRRDEREVERLLREGDLIEVDAERGLLRVLGQSRETMTLHEGFRSLRQTVGELEQDPESRLLLALRGRRLKASRQIETVLEKLSDPSLIRYAVDEILLGDGGFGPEAHGLKARFLSRLFAGGSSAGWTRLLLAQSWETLERRRLALRGRADRRIAVSREPYEILALRLTLLHLAQRLDLARPLLREHGVLSPAEGAPAALGDGPVRTRLTALREEKGHLALEAAAAEVSPSVLRPLLGQVKRLDLVLGTREESRLPWVRAAESLRRREREIRERVTARRIIRQNEASLCLSPWIGWKAASLAVVETILGAGRVPSWFAIAHPAFEDALDQAVPPHPDGTGGALGEEILAVLARRDLPPGEQSRLIGALWDAVEVPPRVADEVLGAYRGLSPTSSGEEAGIEDPVVAVRSSTREEDLEGLPRAGEFETFLFIQGDDPLLVYLRRAWAGFWTERALFRRRREGSTLDLPGGGILIQHIIRSRASGVLHTANVAEGEPGEMLINAGLGMGEGVVSGTVPVDHVRVSKEGATEGPLRFRYVVADKREQIVPDTRTGRGTVRVEAPYHQRSRPALEYAELHELVRLAARLEAGYGCPLDLEFALEGSRLWILQARPLGVYRAALRETVTRSPLTGTPPLPLPLFDTEVEP